MHAKAARDSLVPARVHLDWQCGHRLRPHKVTAYYVNILSALLAHPHVGSCNVETSTSGHSTCTLVFGHLCTTGTTTFLEQVQAAERRLDRASSAANIAVFLNKVYVSLPDKLDLVRQMARHKRVRHVNVFSWSPVVGQRPPLLRRDLAVNVSEWNLTDHHVPKVSFHFVPFATDAHQLNVSTVERRRGTKTKYRHDVFFAGDTNPLKYDLRRDIVELLNSSTSQPDSLPRLLQPYLPTTFLNYAQYQTVLAQSRTVLSTPLKEWLLVGTRYYEVLASGTALLLCYREPLAYLPLGIVEGEHALMFSSVAEFTRLLVRHAIAHETAAARAHRKKMLENAQRLVATKHTWAHRASQIVEILRMRSRIRPLRRSKLNEALGLTRHLTY